MYWNIRISTGILLSKVDEHLARQQSLIQNINGLVCHQLGNGSRSHWQIRLKQISNHATTRMVIMWFWAHIIFVSATMRTLYFACASAHNWRCVEVLWQGHFGRLLLTWFIHISQNVWVIVLMVIFRKCCGIDVLTALFHFALLQHIRLQNYKWEPTHLAAGQLRLRPRKCAMTYNRIAVCNLLHSNTSIRRNWIWLRRIYKKKESLYIA